MPMKRLEKTRQSLPAGYQFGDAIGEPMRRLMDTYGDCQYCGRGITLCSAFPCASREEARRMSRTLIDAMFAKSGR